MKNITLLNIGLAGTSITLLCCFTPILVMFLGFIGLSAIVGILDLESISTGRFAGKNAHTVISIAM